MHSLKFKQKKWERAGFTLIELLVVIAIIGTLSGLVLTSTSTMRAKARDAQRLKDMKQIVLALQLYYDKNGRYPNISSDACCDGWDQGPCAGDPFIGALATDGFLNTPIDPLGGSGTGCYGYRYYLYNAGTSGCPAARGKFFVLGITNMETSAGAYPTSPGWSCPSRNWQSEMEWVIGGFEI